MNGYDQSVNMLQDPKSASVVVLCCNVLTIVFGTHYDDQSGLLTVRISWNEIDTRTGSVLYIVVENILNAKLVRQKIWSAEDSQ